MKNKNKPKTMLIRIPVDKEKRIREYLAFIEGKPSDIPDMISKAVRKNVEAYQYRIDVLEAQNERIMAYFIALREAVDAIGYDVYLDDEYKPIY